MVAFCALVLGLGVSERANVHILLFIGFYFILLVSFSHCRHERRATAYVPTLEAKEEIKFFSIRKKIERTKK